MASPMSPEDCRALARERFRSPQMCTSAFDFIERYASDPPQVTRTLLEAVRSDAPTARICELGFGTGWLLQAMREAFPEARLHGLDLSEGMARHVRELLGPDVTITIGDMESLPFREAVFDTIVTCWTLYFMRDIDAALAGIAACLRPGGRLVAATVAPDHMAELDELHDAARRALHLGADPGVSNRFNLDTGLTHMRWCFPRVEVREWRGWMTLPDAETLIGFWDVWHVPRPVEEQDGRLRDEVARRARARSERGDLRIRRHGGVLIGFWDSEP